MCVLTLGLKINPMLCTTLCVEVWFMLLYPYVQSAAQEDGV